MASTAYPGRPLRTNEIRLVKIQPGAWRDPIRCDLFNAEPDRTRYHALSYVWGSRGVSRWIYVEDQVYPATVNLERALRYLRNQYKEEFIWIDALCINQENTEERTHQVGLMDRIYMECQKVVVFLGDRLQDKAPGCNPAVIHFTDDDSSPPELAGTVGGSKHRQGHGAYGVLSLIQQLSSGKHLYDIPAFQPSKIPRSQGNQEEVEPAEFEIQGTERQRTRLFESLRRLMHGPYTPWWDRVWVIQEVTLAPLIDIVHGNMTAPWSMFAKAAASYNTHMGTCCSRFAAKLPRDHIKVVTDFGQRVQDVADLRKIRYLGANQLVDTSDMTLLSLLRRFRDRQASDARDKVYALLSMAKDVAGSSMKPDYSLSEVQVFARATVHCIKSTQYFSVFNTELGRKFRNDLPSWVPDWGAPGNYSLDDRAAALELYDDYPKGTITCLPLGDGELVLWGGHVARISHVNEVMWGDVGSMVQDTLAAWWREISSSPNFFPGIQFWRLMCADVICRPHSIDNVRRTTPEDELKFATWALESEKSPFFSASYHTDMWSYAASAWQAVLVLWDGRDILSEYLLTVLSAEDIAPRRFVTDKPARLIHTKSLVHFARCNLDTWDMIEPDSHEFQKDAPWRDLLNSVRERLIETYTEDVDLDIKSHRDFIPVINHSIITATLSRRLIRVVNPEYGERYGKEYYGLGPADAAVGGSLFVLDQGRTPFIMRYDSQNALEGYSKYHNQIWSRYKDPFSKLHGSDLADYCSKVLARTTPYRWRILAEKKHADFPQSAWSSEYRVVFEDFWGLVAENEPEVFETLRLGREYLFKKRYRIIGDCYLQGFVYSEVEKVKGLVDWDNIVLV